MPRVNPPPAQPQRCWHPDSLLNWTYRTEDKQGNMFGKMHCRGCKRTATHEVSAHLAKRIEAEGNLQEQFYEVLITKLNIEELRDGQDISTQ